jgi:iron complex outermembrane recepter protein
MRQRLFNSAAILAAAGTGLITAPAFAQEGTEADDSSSDIVVTAQRREEKAKDVPITLTTITAEALGQGDVQQLSDIAKLTPALRFDNYGGFVQPTIRGVGTAVSASGAGSNVGIYVDGFYAPNPLSNDFQLLNVSSVTVLKGPQGTLFGRNSTGGAIQVTTSDPSAETRGIAEVSYGRFNSQKYQAYITTGSDTIAFDLAALYRKGDGFVRNIVTGSKKDAAYDVAAVSLHPCRH